MESKKNEYLKVQSNVVLDDFLDGVLVKLEKKCKEKNVRMICTSGIRTEEDQLRIIRNELKKRKLDVKYPEAMSGAASETIQLNGETVYKWQMGWSALLNVNFIVNPPLKAKVLMNYINASGVNRKGSYIEPSIHFKKLALDFGGGANGINDETAFIQEVMPDIPEIVSIVPERNNNCVHINLRHI
jgi:hypothetical protein